jgi:hypothetical protein
MIMGLWGLLAIVASLAVAVIRELLILRKDAARRDSIERLVTIAPSGLRIIDRTSDGGVIEIIVDHARGSQRQVSHSHDQAAP